MQLISGILVVLFGLGLTGLALAIVIRPGHVERFLEAFASSARNHYAEQAVRLVVGTALVVYAPSMWYPHWFQSLGWLIVATSVGLLLIPWQWHQRFGKWAIPLAIRYLKLYGVAAFALGALILYGASRSVFS